MRSKAIWLALLISAQLGGCDGRRPVADHEAAERHTPAAEQVAAILAELPSWAHTQLGRHDRLDFDGDDHDAYELAGIQLQAYTVADIEAGLELALEGVTRVEEWLAVRAKLFLLLRVAFDVPAALEHSDVKVFGPIFAAAHGSDRAPDPYPVGWPVYFDAHGRVSNITVYRQPHGTPYPIIAELDWFNTDFGWRDLPSCVGRCGRHDASEICQCDADCAATGSCCVDFASTCES